MAVYSFRESDSTPNVWERGSYCNAFQRRGVGENFSMKRKHQTPSGRAKLI